MSGPSDRLAVGGNSVIGLLDEAVNLNKSLCDKKVKHEEVWGKDKNEGGKSHNSRNNCDNASTSSRDLVLALAIPP